MSPEERKMSILKEEGRGRHTLAYKQTKEAGEPRQALGAQRSLTKQGRAP